MAWKTYPEIPEHFKAQYLTCVLEAENQKRKDGCQGGLSTTGGSIRDALVHERLGYLRAATACKKYKINQNNKGLTGWVVGCRIYLSEASCIEVAAKAAARKKAKEHVQTQLTFAKTTVSAEQLEAMITKAVEAALNKGAK